MDAAVTVDPGTDLMRYEQDGREMRASWSTYRGKQARFYPTDETFRSLPGDGTSLTNVLVGGLKPAVPSISKETKIVAFGSCFAEHIGNHLEAKGYDVLNRKHSLAHIAIMGDGIVNTHAVLQQFRWAWDGWQPWANLWDDGDAARLATKGLLDRSEVFIITLGLSEAWYDEPTGEVFWRPVPPEKFDPSRHKFRSLSHAENVANLLAVIRLVSTHRPDARIILTLSPIPLAATFRPMACMAANAVSKASLRSAIDEVIDVTGVGYFPSYETVLGCFRQPFMEDRRHVHRHILDFMMTLFEHCHCRRGPDEREVYWAFQKARSLDGIVVDKGHWAVPRTNLKWSKPA